MSMPATCSDGRCGIVMATRDDAVLSGSGTVRLTDGEDETFMFGLPLPVLMPKSAIMISDHHPMRV
jgi:hypothetical protein